MTYNVLDIPLETVLVEPFRGNSQVDLDKFEVATLEIYGPDGVEITETHGSVATIGLDEVYITPPSVSIFTEPGRYEYRVTLTHSTETQRERLNPVFIIVEDEDGWSTLDAARNGWPDAEALDDVTLWELLQVARHQVLEYARHIPDGDVIPLSYVRAQVMQSRNILNAARVDAAAGGDGEGSFMLRPYPLDWTIKQLVRPRAGKPVVF